MLSRLLRASEANGPVLIASQNVADNINSELVFTLPSTALTDDVLIVFTNATSLTKIWTGPGSFTELYNPGVGWAVFTRAVSGADTPGTTTYTFSQSDTPVASRGSMLVFRNTSYETIGSAASGTTVSAPSITLTNDKSYVIAYYRDTGSGSFTTPTGFTSLTQITAGPASASFGKSVDAGATGSVASTGSGANPSGILVGLGPL